MADFQNISRAAESNLYTGLRNAGVGENDLRARASSILGSATEQQIRDIASGNLSSANLGSLATRNPTNNANSGLPQPAVQQPTFDSASLMGDFTAALQGILPQGLASSMNFEDIFSNNMEGQIKDLSERNRAILESQRQAALEGGKIQGAKELGTTKGVLADATGGELGFSSIEKSIIDNQVSRNEKRLRDINTEFNKALLDNDSQTVQLLSQERQQRIQNLLQLDSLVINRLNAALGVQRENRLAQEGAVTKDINILSALSGIPAGQEVTIGGQTYTGLAQEEIDPFFKGGDVVDIMQTLPLGQTVELLDPNTGETISLTGLAQPDANTQVIQSTDAAGNLTITTIDKATGKIVGQVSAGKVGKPSAGGGGSSTTGLTLSGTDQQYFPLLDFNQETGQYEVSTDKVESYISQKGDDRLTVANRAGALADQLNAELATQQESGAAEGAIEEASPWLQFTNSFGTGNFAQKPLSDRVEQLLPFFTGDLGGIQVDDFREQLLQDGYPAQDVLAAVPKTGLAGFGEAIGTFFGDLFGG